MLSRLVVKNFKSIGEPGVDLELKPLTILVGPNGSGKSSIFEAVAVGARGHCAHNVFDFVGIDNVYMKSYAFNLRIDIFLKDHQNWGIGLSIDRQPVKTVHMSGLIRVPARLLKAAMGPLKHTGNS